MVINYWNITNYQPFFNRDSHGMEELKERSWR